MIQSLIIEDEAKGRETLINYLHRFCPDVEVIGITENVVQGIAQINKLQPELVFLDISLPDGNGFDILEKVDNNDFELIFVTAYNEYALNAIKKSKCVDYLIKPISIKELQIAVEKAKNNIIKQSEFILLKKFDNKPHKITIPTIERNIVINVDDIIYCQADRSWTTIYLKDKIKIVSSKNLSTFERVLLPYDFYRTHRSYLINLAEVKSYVKRRGGKVMMSNDNEIEISDAKKAAFIKKLNIVE